MFGFINLVIETVQKKVDQIRNDRLCTFGFEKLHQMIVGRRCEFNQNFPDDADTGFFLVCDRYRIKFPNHFTAYFAEGKVVHMFFGYELTAYRKPFFMNGIDGTGCLFVGAHAVDTAHENIPEYGAVSEAEKQIRIQVEARIAFNSGKV